jgi:hypothetical protein
MKEIKEFYYHSPVCEMVATAVAVFIGKMSKELDNIKLDGKYRSSLPRITVCGVILDNEDGESFTLRCGYSVCSPNDRFNRKTGRELARSRVDSQDDYMVETQLYRSMPTKENFIKLSNEILRTIISSYYI